MKLKLLTGMITMAIILTAGAENLQIYHAPLKFKAYSREFDAKANVEKNFLKLSRVDQDEQLLVNAIDDLQYHLSRITGRQPEIVVTSNPVDIKLPAIVIGTLADCPLPAEATSTDAYRIKIAGNKILISGRNPGASAHGIYGFLNQLGCTWIMPGAAGEIIPESKEIELNGTDIVSVPDFAYRRFWYGGFCRNAQARYELFVWCQRMRLNVYIQDDFQTGGHSWSKLVKQYKEEFEKDPTMYALVRQSDGSMKRSGPQIETTNPKVVDLAIRYIRETYRENKWPNDRLVCIPMGPADGGAISESPESMQAGAGRISPDSGRYDGTDHVVLFLNTILEKTKDEFPNLHLGFFLYSWHADYPMKYTPNPRIAINVADINFSRFHGTGDAGSRSRSYFKNIIGQWSKLHKKQGNIIEYRPYSWNLADGYLPYTKLKIWGEDIPFMKEMGASAFMVNAYNDWAVNGPHTYLAARMAWDSSIKWQEFIPRYCQQAYGSAAAPFMTQYYLTLAERQSKAGQEAGSIYPYTLIYNQQFVDRMNSLFQQALSATSNQADKVRLEIAQLPMRHMQKYLNFRTQIAGYDFNAAARTYQDIIDGINAANKQNIHSAGPQGLVFIGRFFKDFLEQGKKYTAPPYRIIHRIPERLKTAFDPYTCGQNLNYYGVDVNDEHYIVTSTYNSTFDAQGLGGYRTGAVWYRDRFRLTSEEKKADEGYGLFIGGADNTVRVWCNGRHIGQGDRSGLCKPRIFDLTEALNPNGENLLAIQVIRFGNYELGTGGLMLPSFIFQGPRLDKKAETGRPFRMLPGGVIEYIN